MHNLIHSSRGYGQLLTRRGRHRSLPTLLLETLPPIFHILLLSSLTYNVFALNPGSQVWPFAGFFIVGQILANWAFFLMNKSIVLTSPKNFPGYLHKYPSLTSTKGFQETRQEFETVNSEWKECDSCDMHVPLRTHHCGHCRRCIYILDHHCYFLGFCVGRTNMRYFIIFCFYASVGCALGVYNIMTTMISYREPMSKDFPFYLLPYTILMFFMDKAASFEVFYVAQINFGSGACGACLYLFCVGMYSVFTGRTPYEEKKKKKMLKREGEFDEDDKTCCDRFRDVFGQCGLMHFFIPLVPFDMPKAELGYRRLITYNNDYILNGTVHSSETSLDYVP